jgi:hypothetical protein
MIDGLTLMHDFYLGKLENPRGLITNPPHKSAKPLTLKDGVSFYQPNKQSPPPERLCCNLAKLSFRASPTLYQVRGRLGARPGIQERGRKSNHPGSRLASRFAGFGRDDELGHAFDRDN